MGTPKTIKRPTIIKLRLKNKKKVEQITRLNIVSLTFAASKVFAELFIETGELNLRSNTIDVRPPLAVRMHAKIIIEDEPREANKVIRRK
tara:strand:+ start:236 stop:505 length:270 start_codon:yes stop_codon:yes gene_type:complete